jgi:hypothetical protein
MTSTMGRRMSQTMTTEASIAVLVWHMFGWRWMLQQACHMRWYRPCSCVARMNAWMRSVVLVDE